MNTSLIIRRITAILTANVQGASLGQSQAHSERFEEGIKGYNCGARGWDLAKDSLPDHFFQSLTIHFWSAALSGVGEFEAVRT